eukprot:TRINITY_DN103377_c0_g1_i1.p1 TRINITY_DN103377_c0_g1~~TRINITY_DN103377_c0_g1_i1.p1  ORF type:complete len:480 (+),score=116.90 TRINITY_DN103377_c0_g1_i1:103-1542(+)
MAQDRKVFVGGVPQDLNQDDLYAIFSEYAGVKKAWLQKCRTSDDGSSNANPPQNHRGFGFVIFHDAHAIDEILGSAPSRFILLRNGTKLEVKRALSSNKMSGPQGNVLELSEQPQAAARPPGRGAQTQPPLISQGPPSRVMPAPAGPTRAAAGRPLTAPWAGGAAGVAALGDDTILRQLSLMHGAGYTVPSQGALSAAAAAMASNAPLGVNSVAYAQPHIAGPAPPGQQQPASHPAVEQGGRHPLLRNAIMQFYHEHRPEKLTERDFVDFICNVYEGREQELDEALRQKYGIGLQLGQQPLLSQQVHQAVREKAKASAELVSRQRAAAASAAAAAAAAAGLPAGFQDPAYAGLQEAWLQAGGPAAAAAAAATAAAAAAVAAQGQQQRSPVLGPWMDPAIADAYIGGAAFGAAAATGAHHDLRFHDADSPSKIDPEGPDFSWIDQIVGDESLEIPEEVARAIVNKSATKHRTELLQTAVW